MARALRSFGGAHALLPMWRRHSCVRVAEGDLGSIAPRESGQRCAPRCRRAACPPIIAKPAHAVAVRRPPKCN